MKYRVSCVQKLLGAKLWGKAYQLYLKIYKLVRSFSVEERYALSLQLRRAGVSILSNIAKGYSRKTRGEYIHYLYVAYGSYCGLESQLLLAVKMS